MQNHKFNSPNHGANATPLLQKHDRVMQPEQFNQVIDAILSGKYSWACVLILKFAGYNPLHYIPYRTYNRIVKDNVAIKREAQSERNSPSAAIAFKDLGYVKSIDSQENSVRGGAMTWVGYSPY
jgi:hypothetical protein